jgi:hypothetical protein
MMVGGSGVSSKLSPYKHAVEDIFPTTASIQEIEKSEMRQQKLVQGKVAVIEIGAMG